MKQALLKTAFGPLSGIALLIPLCLPAPSLARDWDDESAMAALEAAAKPEGRNRFSRDELLEAGQYLFDGCGDRCLLAYLHAFDPKLPRERKFLDKALLVFAGELPSHVLDRMDRYRSLPNADRIIRIAAESSAHGGVEHASLYKGRPYADSLLQASVFRLAKENAYFTLKYADRFAHRPYAEEIIRKAAAAEPGAALGFSDRFRNRPYAKAILDRAWDEAPAKDPRFFLDSLEQFMDRPDLNRALLTVASHKPMEIVKAGKKVLKCPGGDSLYLAASKRLAKENPEMLLYLLAGKSTPGVTDEVLETAVRKAAMDTSRNTVFRHAGMFRDKPYAKEVMTLALSNGGDLWSAIPDIIEKPYAEELLKIGAKRNPWSALRNISKYENKPYGYDVVRIAAEGSPEGVFRNLGYTQDFPITIELRKQAEIRFLRLKTAHDSCFVWGFQKEFKDQEGVRKALAGLRVDEARCYEILDRPN